MIAAGLLEALGGPPVTQLPRPVYSPEPQAGTRIRNGRTMRDFNLALAAAVRDVRRGGEFVLVIGGDCSILLGALAGARAEGPVSLIHIDGHSDFRHPGNYDVDQNPGAAAGMDLALATGRGEPLATEWPGIVGPLVADADAIQVGERESRDPDFAWPDVRHTAIDTIDVFEALAIGPEGVAARIATVLAAKPDQGFWMHLDVDVLDEAVMPAVDSPGSPGIPPDDLVEIMRPLVADERCRGMTVTVFDPDLDPHGRYAHAIVSLLARLPFPAPAAAEPVA
jgi:arginase